MKCSLDISNFLEEIFSLSHSTVFSISFSCSFKEAFLQGLSVLILFQFISKNCKCLLYSSILMICENWESNKVLNATLAPSFQRNQVLILAFEVYKIVHKFSLYHCWKRYDSCYSYTQFLFQDLPVWTPLTSRHFTNLCHLIFISDNYYLQFTLSKMSLKENKSWPKFTIT